MSAAVRNAEPVVPTLSLSDGAGGVAASADRDGAPHPLEDSAHLAWQATAAVGLLERFGDLLTVALEAVGGADDDGLAAALAERERLMHQLEPLLGALAAARHDVHSGATTGSNARRALDGILRPVDEALRHAQLLHSRLADEVGHRPAPRPGRRAPIALVH